MVYCGIFHFLWGMIFEVCANIISKTSTEYTTFTKLFVYKGDELMMWCCDNDALSSHRSFFALSYFLIFSIYSNKNSTHCFILFSFIFSWWSIYLSFFIFDLFSVCSLQYLIYFVFLNLIILYLNDILNYIWIMAFSHHIPHCTVALLSSH